MKISSKDGSKVMTVIASPGQGPDRSTEVSYTDTKVSAKLRFRIMETYKSKKFMEKVPTLNNLDFYVL